MLCLRELCSSVTSGNLDLTQLYAYSTFIISAGHIGHYLASAAEWSPALRTRLAHVGGLRAAVQQSQVAHQHCTSCMTEYMAVYI